MNLPSFIIVGGEKCGTTFLHHCLMDHPQIFMPRSEIPFFEDPDYHRDSWENFVDLFKATKPGKVIGLKRPNYLYKNEVSHRLKKHLGPLKIIITVRDPINRVLSSYYHNVAYGFIPPLDVEEGLGLLLDGSLKKTYPRSVEILEFSFYYQSIRKYVEMFGRDNVLVLVYKDLLTSPVSFVQSVYKFLNVKASYIPKKVLATRPQSSVYSINRLKWLSLRNKFIFDYNQDLTRLFPKVNLSWSEIVGLSMVNIIDRSLVRHIFPEKKPVVSSEITARLLNLYISDIKKLQRFMGRDLSFWVNDHVEDRFKKSRKY